MSFLLIKGDSIKNFNKANFLTDGTNPVNWNLLQYLNNSILKSQCIHVAFTDLLIIIDEKHLMDIESFLKEKKYSIFNNYDDYNSLIKIQNFKTIINSNTNFTFEIQESDKKSKGKFYTPKILADFITELLLNVSKNKEELKLFLDPSCGSGLFLSSILEYFSLNNSIKLGSLKLEGKDIDFKSLLTACLLITYTSLLKKKNLNDFVLNLSHEDFLLHQEENEAKYDAIIGNPPYIRERFFDKTYRGQLMNFKTYKGKSDLYFAFIEQSCKLLRPNGYLVFLLPRYWLESNFGVNLRDFINKFFELELLIDFQTFRLFSIGVHSCILLAKKKGENMNHKEVFTSIIVKATNKNYKVDDLLTIIKKSLKGEDKQNGIISNLLVNQSEFNSTWLLQSGPITQLFKKINAPPGILLKSIAIIKEGINTGADKVARHHIKLNSKFIDNIGSGIFVLSLKEVNNLDLTPIEKEIYIKKWIKGKNITKWIINSQDSWLIYFTKQQEIPINIINHLSNFKEILENRAEIKRNSNRRVWYELAWPRQNIIFETKPKLLIRYKSKNPIVAIDESGYYTSADFRVIIVDKLYNPYVILALLNSNIIRWILNNLTKKLGTVQDYYSYTLESLFLRYPSKEMEQSILENVLALLNILINEKTNKTASNGILKDVSKIEHELNQIIYRLYQLDENEIKLIESTY